MSLIWVPLVYKDVRRMECMKKKRKFMKLTNKAWY